MDPKIMELLDQAIGQGGIDKTVLQLAALIVSKSQTSPNGAHRQRLRALAAYLLHAPLVGAVDEDEVKGGGL